MSCTSVDQARLKSWSAGGAISKIFRKNLIPCVSRS